MTPDPRRLPTSVVRKIQKVVEYVKGKYPGRITPFEVTCTLKIDIETGKILDGYFMSERDKETGKVKPGIITRWTNSKEGKQIKIPYGKMPDDM